MIRMLVVVQTAISLGVGEQVFLTGNIEELGRWNVSAVPMTRTDDNRWEANLSLWTDGPIEFKVTRGTWETEEVNANGALMPNHVLTPVDGGTRRDPGGGLEGCAPVQQARLEDHRRYRFLPKVHSQFLEHDRDVIVWFPPGYEARADPAVPGALHA